jgi:hypothetical protein
MNVQGVVGEMYTHMWPSLAARSGNEYIRKKRDEVAANMTPDQIAEAQRLAREWKPTK